MPWCPQCKCEYDEGIKTCYDCQCDLVDELLPNDKLSENQPQSSQDALLMTVADEMEYRIVEAKLGQFGIPANKRYREAGAVTYIYMGRTFGLDVYVPEAALTQAKEIMGDHIENNQINEADQTDEEQGIDEIAEKGTWSRKILLTFIVMVLGLLGLLAIMYLISFFSLI